MPPGQQIGPTIRHDDAVYGAANDSLKSPIDLLEPHHPQLARRTWQAHPRPFFGADLRPDKQAVAKIGQLTCCRRRMALLLDALGILRFN
jgi:hypothetical protein